MYHIFIAASLILAQNFLTKESTDYLAQKKAKESPKQSTIDQVTEKEENIQEYVVEEDLIDKVELSNEEQGDVLEILRKKEQDQEKELAKISKQDIESLGLDIVDDDFASTKVLSIKDTEEKEEKDEDNFSTLGNNKITKEKKIKDVEEKTETSQDILLDKDKKQIKDKKDDIKKIGLIAQIGSLDDDIISEDLSSDFKDSKKTKEESSNKIFKDDRSQDDKNIIESVGDSLSKAKDKISKTFGINQNDKKKSLDAKNGNSKEENTRAEADVEIVDKERIEAEEIKRKENEELERLRHERAMILMEEREKKKQKTLIKLRKEYLDVFSKNLEIGVNKNYTIPKKKVLPRFISYPTPAPLLKRAKSFKNKHHPDIVTKEENIKLMFTAISQDRIDDFEALFKIVNDPNLRNSYGDTLLIFSLLMQKHEAVSFLLANRANPNLKNKLGYTPLNVAIELADYISVEMLVNMGANINFSDYFGMNYLMQSVKVGYFPIIDFLVQKGLDVNIVDNAGFTALDIAYRDKKELIVKYLRLYGAKTWIKKDYEKKQSLIDELESRWQ